MSHYCDRHGNTVGADEALDRCGNLRSGFGVRVPLTMMDAMQRDVAEFFDGKRRTKTVERDPKGRERGTFETEEENEKEEKRSRKRHCDAATGFFDSRGVYFPPDQRMVDAKRVTEYLSGRDAASRQMWLDGRAAVDAARQEMINDNSSARHQGDFASRADITPRRAVSFADAQYIKREAYEQMVRDADYRTRSDRHG